MSSSAQQTARIDALMEEAAKALAARKPFEAERASSQAVRKAYAGRHYEKLAGALKALSAARAAKLQAALASAKKGNAFVVTGELPTGKALGPGCYLIGPPRVGVDGRLLREAADRKETAILVLVREPTTREGLWPVVALGPVTVRAKVKAPTSVKKKAGAKGGKSTAGEGETEAPPPEWFASTLESLGEAALASIPEDPTPHGRVDALIARLDAVPDHAGLHQALEKAAMEASRSPMKPAAFKKRPPFSEEADVDF